MLDIKFYKRIFKIKKDIIDGHLDDKRDVFQKIEESRSDDPTVFNIETTNLCNMKCKMCPRTTLMMRKLNTLDIDTYKRIIEQITPFSNTEWSEWEDFAEENYKISKTDMSENHFFLYIIPKVIVLHGFGEPLLDKRISERVSLLSDKGFPTYFSCNPANINVEKMKLLFDSGLTYIKFSLDSINDNTQKQIRGNAANFTGSYEKILQLIDIKNKNNYKTTLIVTMIDLQEEWQKDEFNKFKSIFNDIYTYKKTQDEQWYTGVYQNPTSIHWLEFCQFPWSSISILSNGNVVPCTQDFDSEITLGNVKNSSLKNIWNSSIYKKLRECHFNMNYSIKCIKKCDMKLVGSFLK